MKAGAIVGIVIGCLIFVTILTILCVCASYRSPFEKIEYVDKPCNFPIDIVYTWVDGTDENWKRLKDSYVTNSLSHGQNSFRWPESRTKDDMYYSLKSLYKFFPHFRYVWIVTQRPQIPKYLDEFDDRIKVVFHDEIFDSVTTQPTFNSHAIEANIHNIQGLSEHFIYMNDDFFFGKPCKPNFFFTPDGKPVFRGEFWPYWIVLLPFHEFLNYWNRLRKIIDKKRGKKTKVCILMHAPIGLTRSICKASRTTHREYIDKTIQNRFRSPTDVPPIGLALYDGSLDNKVVELEKDLLKFKMYHKQIKKIPDAHTFCINAFQGKTSYDAFENYFGSK